MMAFAQTDLERLSADMHVGGGRDMHMGEGADVHGRGG